MSVSVATSFNRTLEKTNLWIRDLDRELGWDNRDRAYHALRAVLHALRDQLSIAEVAGLAAQLPMLLKGVYYENWRPHHPDTDWRKDDFLDCISNAFPGDPSADPEQIAQAVFTVLSRRVSDGEIGDIKCCLPHGVREMWE